jgi:PKHD-type hydroxylase
MIFKLKNVLSADELKEINQTLEDQSYIDGRETAANAASLVKRNIQLPAASDVRLQLNRKIKLALRRQQMFVWLRCPSASAVSSDPL